MVTTVDGRTFDWAPRFDPRSLEYRAAARQRSLPTSGRLWDVGPVLDQGAEGACVGFGSAGAVAAAPSSRSGVDDAYALAWYRRAQRLDEWPGEAYSGTSVLAGCLVGRERKLWTGFRWAKNPAELAAGILDDELGPAILGVPWSEHLYDIPANGLMPADVDLSGNLGHCVLVFGYLPAWDTIEHGDDLANDVHALGLVGAWQQANGPVFLLLNSWGTSWGVNGMGVVPLELMQRWVDARGEFALPVSRAKGGQPATAAPAEAARAGDVTLSIRADELQDGDRLLDPPDELGADSTTVIGTPGMTSGWMGRQIVVRSTVGTFRLLAGAAVKVRRRRP